MNEFIFQMKWNDMKEKIGWPASNLVCLNVSTSRDLNEVNNIFCSTLWNSQEGNNLPVKCMEINKRTKKCKRFSNGN